MVERAGSSRQQPAGDRPGDVVVGPDEEKRFVAAVRHLLSSPPAPKLAKKKTPGGVQARPRSVRTTDLERDREG